MMRRLSAALMAVAAFVSNEPSNTEKVRMTRGNAAQKPKATGKDRTKVKAARKQRRKRSR